MDQLQLTISGMSCGHCVSRVNQALSRLEGVSVEHVEVGAARLSYDPEKVTPSRITASIDELGFEARSS